MELCPLSTVDIPTQFDFAHSIEAIRMLTALAPSHKYVIDFSHVKFYEPFAMLLFSSVLRRFRDRCKAEYSSTFKAIGYGNGSNANTYAANIGFFESFGIKDAPATLQGNTQYRPIQKLVIGELCEKARQQREDVRDTLERECLEIAAILLRSQSGDLHSTLGYSLREIFRNVIEHSKSPDFWYTAQYWQEKGVVELAILDEGIGIQKALIKNPHVKINGDPDALKLAILPGISGKAFKGGPKRRDDPWANSGYGLFMTSQLCNRGGSFFIGSGTSGLLMSNGETTEYGLGFSGTVVRLVIDVTKVGYLNATLKELIREGARIAGDLKQATIITASKSSSMLARDFKNVER